MRIWTQKSASIRKRTSPLKFDNFAEKSEKDTVSYLSSKLRAARRPPRLQRASHSRSQIVRWPAISDLEQCHFPFPGIRFRIPFSPYPPFSLFPGNVSAFFCKIHKLPVILCHFPQFRQNSVKFAAKNARFAERSAKFRKKPELSKKTCKITQKFALERCEGVTIL